MLVMIMFFLALLMLSMAVAAPTTINAIQRDREEEMVWRGKQYVRGVRLFYLKTHRFPVELDDLTKPKTLGVRYMRKAYKDPMNLSDGSWRLIYLGPGGTLIGSLKSKCLNSVLTGQGSASGIANSATGGASSFGGGTNTFSSSSFGGSSFSTAPNSSNSLSGSSGATSAGSTAAACGGQTGANSSDPNASQGSSDAMNQPHDIASTDLPPTVMGGNIIGVGSKVDKQSFLWYDKARNYRLFEFVWDPTIDVLTGQRQGGQIPGAVTPGTVNPSGTPLGQSGNPVSPGQMPNAPASPNGPDSPPLQAPTNP